MPKCFFKPSVTTFQKNKKETKTKTKRNELTIVRFVQVPFVRLRPFVQVPKKRKRNVNYVPKNKKETKSKMKRNELTIVRFVQVLFVWLRPFVQVPKKKEKDNKKKRKKVL